MALAVGAGIALAAPAAAGQDIPLPRLKPVLDEPGPASAAAAAPGAAYEPGIDGRGRPVAPADLPRTQDPAGAVSGWVTIPLKVQGGPARQIEVEVPLPLPTP